MIARALAVVFAATVGATVARAQAPTANANDPATTIAPSPAESPPNGVITISGLGYSPVGGHVTVTVTPPAAPGSSGAPITLTAPADSSGRYAVTFSKTGVDGTYKIAAQIGAKDVPSHSTFTIKTYPIDIDEDVADNKALLVQADSLVQQAKKTLDSIPDSPAKTEAEHQLDDLRDQTEQVAQQGPKVTAAFAPYRDMLMSHTEVEPVMQGFVDHVADLGEASKKTHEQVAAEIEGSQGKAAQCDRIDQATQAIKWVPQLISMAKRPMEFLDQYAQDMATAGEKSMMSPTGGKMLDVAKNYGKLTDKMIDASNSEDTKDKAVDAAKDYLAENEMELGSETETADRLVEMIPESVRSTPAYKFAVAQSKMFLPGIVNGTKDPLALLNKTTTLAGNVLGYLNDQAFGKYCQKFEGPFTATMVAHFYSKPLADGQIVEWWGYTTAIKGRIVLRYPKEAEGTAVPLSGQLEGGATKFTYHEDVWHPELFGKMAGGGKILHADIPPLPADDASGGVGHALTSPTSFYLPITGKLVDGKVTVDAIDSRSDFVASYVKAHTVYVVEGPTTLGIPIFGQFTLPYVNAEFILNQVVKGDYSLTESGESMVMQRDTTRDRPGPGNKAVYTLTLKACNPGCS